MTSGSAGCRLPAAAAARRCSASCLHPHACRYPGQSSTRDPRPAGITGSLEYVGTRSQVPDSKGIEPIGNPRAPREASIRLRWDCYERERNVPARPQPPYCRGRPGPGTGLAGLPLQAQQLLRARQHCPCGRAHVRCRFLTKRYRACTRLGHLRIGTRKLKQESSRCCRRPT